MRKNVKTKTPDFEAAFQKSIVLLANGEGIKKTLAAIGMTWGEYWRGVSNVQPRRQAYIAALESRDEYRKQLAADRLAEVALDPYKEVVAGETVFKIHSPNTPAVVKFAEFMHRPNADKEDAAEEGLRAYQEAMRRLKERIDADPDGTAPYPNGITVPAGASPAPA